MNYSSAVSNILFCGCVFVFIFYASVYMPFILFLSFSFFVLCVCVNITVITRPIFDSSLTQLFIRSNRVYAWCELLKVASLDDNNDGDDDHMLHKIREHTDANLCPDSVTPCGTSHVCTRANEWIPHSLTHLLICSHLTVCRHTQTHTDTHSRRATMCTIHTWSAVIGL